MRARFFGIILRCLERRTPAPLVSLQLQILLNAAARAFGVPGKRIWRLPLSEALQEYAEFTQKHTALPRIDPRKLSATYYALGSRIRRITGFTEAGELQRLVFYLYRNIRIAMTGNIPGTITVSACYFSRFYSADQCRLMAYADSGFIAGLYGGGHLEFSARLTEGCGRCAACFYGAGDNQARRNTL